MTRATPTAKVAALIDSDSPWKITQRGWDWTYSYRTSAKEWRKLLTRAKKGDPEAEWGVADRYSDGCKDKRGKIVVKRSPKKAAQWFRRAAEHGCAPAQNALGVVLSGGHGIKKDIDEALLWLKRSSRAENGCAVQNIAITYREMGNFRAAVKWFRKATGFGDGDAMIQLGIHYYWGKGVREDSKAAVRCFRSAIRSRNISEGGRDDAFFLLGLAQYEGKGVKASLPKAIKLFERANIDDDNPTARAFLRRLNA